MGTMRERTPGTWELVVSAGLDPADGRCRRVIRRIKTTLNSNTHRSDRQIGKPSIWVCSVGPASKSPDQQPRDKTTE